MAGRNKTEIVITAKDDTAAGIASVGRNVDGLKGKFNDLLTIAGGAAGAFTTVGFAQKLMEVQRETDRLTASLVTMTGSSAGAKEVFAALEQFASRTPYSLQEVTSAFIKLKSLGLQPTQKALESYGNTASAMGKSLEQFIEAVADASVGEFERLKEFGIKANQEGGKVSLTFQGVTTTVKKSSDDIVGYLQKIGEVEFAGAMANRMQTLDGAISNLADSWDGLFRTISQADAGSFMADTVNVANVALQDATKIINAMTAAADDNARATGAMATIQQGIGTVFETVAVLGANVAYVFKAVGTEIGGIAAQATALLTGDFAGASRIGDMMKEDAAAARKEIDALSERILNARNATVATAKSLDDLAKPRNGKPPVDPEALKAAKKEADELAKLIDRINGKESGLDAGFWDDLEKLHKGMGSKAIPTLEQYAGLVEKLINQQPFRVKQLKEEEEALKKSAEAQQEYMRGLGDETAKLIEQANTSEQELRTIGLSADEMARLTAARYDEQIAIKQAEAERLRGIDGREAEVYLIEQQIDALGRLKSADVSRPKLQQQAREWENFSRDIEQSLTDAVFRGLENGAKDGGEVLVDTIENTLKASAFKFAVQATITTGGNFLNTGINAVLGTSGNNGGAGVNYFGLANNASSIYNLGGALGSAYTAYTTGAGVMPGTLTYANAVGYAGGDSLGALISTNPQWSAGAASGASAGSTSGAGASSTSSSSALGSVAWIAAIVAGMWMSSEAWKNGVRWEKYAAQDGVKYWDAEVGARALHDEPMRAIFGDGFVDSQLYAILGGGSLSAQIHYGIQKALFGSTYQTGSQISGKFTDAGGGFDGQYGINMKKTGGLFSGSEEWTDWHRMPKNIDAAFDAVYRSVKQSFVALGEVFEDDTVARDMANFSMRFKASTTDVNALLKKIGDTLPRAVGNLVVPAINELRRKSESWAKAFERITAEAATVDRVLDLLGSSIKDAFGEDNINGVMKASDAIVGLFGTIDQLNASVGSYYNNFYTADEKARRVIGKVGDTLESVGIDLIPTTRQEFRALVDDVIKGLDLTTAGGQATFAALMSVQESFASLVPSSDTLTAALASTGQGIAKLVADIRTEITGQSSARVVSAYRADLMGARASDLAASSRLPDSARAYLDVIRNTATSQQQLEVAMARVAADLSALPATANYEQAQLDATRSIIDEINAESKRQAAADKALIQAVNAGFSGYAGSSDGMLTLEELTAGLAGTSTDAEIKRIFEKLDVNQDGVISSLEAVVLATTDSADKIVESLKYVAGRIDFNRDGTVGQLEDSASMYADQTDKVAQVLTGEFSRLKVGQLTQAEIETLIDAPTATIERLLEVADVNKDGILKSNELDAYRNQRLVDLLIASGDLRDVLAEDFARFDTNGDGQLTAAEMRTALHDELGILATNDQLTRLIKSVDEGGNGTISRLDVLADEVKRQNAIATAKLIGEVDAGKITESALVTIGDKMSKAVPYFGKYTGANEAMLERAIAEKLGIDRSEFSALGGADIMRIAQNLGINLGSVLSLDANVTDKTIGSAATDALGMTVAEAIGKKITEMTGATALTKTEANYTKTSEAALEARIASVIGVAPEDIESLTKKQLEALARSLKIPAFAAGGDFAGGLRLVGERGPELEVTGPARIYNFEQTRALFNGQGNSNDELLAEIRALRADNRAQASAIVKLNNEMLKLHKRWDGNGLPETRQVA